MALARIITRFAQQSQPLAEDLRARGFEVQTRSPEEIPSEPADLEIMLEECAPEEALRCATNAIDQDVHVFIAPGAMAETLPAFHVVSRIPEPITLAKPEPESIGKRVPSFAQADPEPADAANDAETQPELVEELRGMAFALEPIVPREPAPATIAISDLETRVEAVEDNATMTSQPEPLMPPEPEPVLATTEPALVAASTHELESPAEADLAEPPAEPIRIVRLPQPAVPDRTRIRRYRVLCKRIFSSDKVFWRTATVASVATVAAALLLVASVQHLPPVPASPVQSSGDSQQQSPFAKTKRSPAVSLRRKASVTRSPQATQAAAAGAKPAVALNPPRPGVNASGMDTGNTAEGKVTPASATVKSKPRHRSAYSSEEDVVAEDTVVRYGDRPATQPQKQPEVKHLSDIQ